MINLWKKITVLVVFIVCVLYALPNIYSNDPIVTINSVNDKIESKERKFILQLIKASKIDYKKISATNTSITIRLNNKRDQSLYNDFLSKNLPGDFISSINMSPNIPDWLQAIDGKQMNLGLDLRGGVHFLMEVNLDDVVNTRLRKYLSDIRSHFRSEKIRYRKISLDGSTIILIFQNNEYLVKAKESIDSIYTDTFDYAEYKNKGDYNLELSINIASLDEIRKAALKQNITTLRNRVNELGVAEPLVQQSGKNRVVVELPGVQDTKRAKDIIGATATLEFRLVDTTNETDSSDFSIKSKAYKDKYNNPVILKREVILTGENIVDASSGFDQNSRPAVNITLDSIGAKKFSRVTDKNVGKPMAVIYIESKSKIKNVDGKIIKSFDKDETVINVATIQERLSKTFQITGLDNPLESRDLALFLRAGSMAAPMYIIEERTVGPSLGEVNISQGQSSVILGLLLVLIFMLFYYKVFGLVANLALIFNIIIIVSVMSMIPGATLTLPGIAGIVLTVGMAVDANVLIFERIREELRNESTPMAAIELGYKKAFSTIADANITTLIASIILFMFGTGPIKGFAVTLSIGILSSMFTAILFTRIIVETVYRKGKTGQKVSKLWI
ncbi:MAG: protein translocase subunit SecD [Pseudomonadota bacterium]|nr:protein translocase subunit SecD [Pseudomonadota bacterium]